MNLNTVHTYGQAEEHEEEAEKRRNRKNLIS